MPEFLEIAHPPCVSGVIVCSIEGIPELTYYVKYVTDRHSSGGLSHLRRYPISAEVVFVFRSVDR